MNSDENHPQRPVDDMPVASQIDANVPILPSDITERLSPAEQASFFATLVDSAADAIIAHRSDGTVIWFNQGTCDLLGYKRADLAHMKPYGWIAPELMAGSPRRIERILHDGRLTFSSAALRKDGTTIATEVRARRVDTPLGPVIVSVLRDVSDRIEAQRALERLAYHDGLTGLSNRARLAERLSLAIADAKRYGDLLGLAYIDLDGFKPINDLYGHQAGDDVLVEIGRRLREDVREQDTVARLGGDEFVIVLQRMGAGSELVEVAERLVMSIEAPIVDEGQILNVRASIGLALFDPAADDERSLLVKADVAMYRAKADHLTSWAIYSPEMDARERRAST